MEYIIISIMTISIFTYIVYMLANKLFSVQMPIKYLILCACCSLVISLILPRFFIGSAGLLGTLSIVIIFAIISSYFIAYYYDAAMQKATVNEDVMTALVEFSFAETLQTDKNEDLQLVAHRTTILQENDSEKILKVPENTEVIRPLTAKNYYYPMKYDEQDKSFILIEKNDNEQMINSEKTLENMAQLADELIVMTESMAKKYYYPMKYAECNPQILLTTTIKIKKEAEVFNNLMNLKEQTDVILEVIPEVSSKDVYPSSNDLDVLMDFAFLQKEQRNSLQALKAFRQALTLHPDSEVGPFLVMEIGIILKALGSYDEAIKVLTEGRLLPGVINNSMLEQEFINNIAYLRVVKNILVKNSLAFMPFNLIPENAFKEIDDEFCEWRNQS